jgi:hypothetical protein
MAGEIGFGASMGILLTSDFGGAPERLERKFVLLDQQIDGRHRNIALAMRRPSARLAKVA